MNETLFISRVSSITDIAKRLNYLFEEFRAFFMRFHMYSLIYTVTNELGNVYNGTVLRSTNTGSPGTNEVYSNSNGFDGPLNQGLMLGSFNLKPPPGHTRAH